MAFGCFKHGFQIGTLALIAPGHFNGSTRIRTLYSFSVFCVTLSQLTHHCLSINTMTPYSRFSQTFYGTQYQSSLFTLKYINYIYFQVTLCHITIIVYSLPKTTTTAAPTFITVLNIIMVGAGGSVHVALQH